MGFTLQSNVNVILLLYEIDWFYCIAELVMVRGTEPTPESLIFILGKKTEKPIRVIGKKQAEGAHSTVFATVKRSGNFKSRHRYG